VIPPARAKACLRGWLLDSDDNQNAEVVAEQMHRALPPRHVTKPRLEHMHLAARPRRLVRCALEHLGTKGRAQTVDGWRRFLFERLGLVKGSA